MKATIKNYYSLTKPGVLLGNVISGVAGFFLATRGSFDLRLFIAAIAGMTLVIASACVINNYFDRDIDSLMERTKNRVIVRGLVTGSHAVIFSLILGIFGLAVLFFYTNILVVVIGIIGFIDYVFFYAMVAKRKSVHGTLVGSISGATPILAGYVAATGMIDAGAILVFLILFFWQMPEFYSISIYRHDEYQAAGVPVISVAKGIDAAKKQIFFYLLAFMTATYLLFLFYYTGYVYLIVMAVIDLYWLYLGLQGFSTPDDRKWARRVFRFSLIALLVFCLMISLNGIFLLP